MTPTVLTASQADFLCKIPPEQVRRPSARSIFRYEAAKRTWLRLFPDATPAQYEEAMRVIAQRVGI